MNKHKVVSYIKSGIRISGFLLLAYSLHFGIGFLVLAEVFGIIEEFDE